MWFPLENGSQNLSHRCRSVTTKLHTARLYDLILTSATGSRSSFAPENQTTLQFIIVNTAIDSLIAGSERATRLADVRPTASPLPVFHGYPGEN